MKNTRYTDEQIAFAFKQVETGISVAEVIRRMGISDQTFYRWKKLYGGLGVGELRRHGTDGSCACYGRNDPVDGGSHPAQNAVRVDRYRLTENC